MLLNARGRVYNRIYNDKEWLVVNKDNKILMEDFLLELKSRKKKESTLKQYKNDIRIILIYILRELENKSILDLNKKNFRNMSLWMIEILQQSNARANRLMSTIRSMLAFAEEDDDYSYEINIALKVKGLPKEGVRDICFLSEEQVTKLREHLRTIKDYKKMCLLDFAYDSAGRRNELHQILKRDLLEKNNTNIVIGKRGKKFPLLYFSRTKESLALYLEQRGEDNLEELWIVGRGEGKKPASYESLYDWFVTMAEMLDDIDDSNLPFNAHSLRHSALENLSSGSHYVLKEIGKEKLELNQLMIYAHHGDVSTTNSYLKVDDNNMLSQTFGISID